MSIDSAAAGLSVDYKVANTLYKKMNKSNRIYAFRRFQQYRHHASKYKII